MHDLTRRLAALGIPCEVTETRGPGDGGALARSVDPHRCRAIVVIGGDGTVNDVINGPVPAGVPVGQLPFGTSNVLAASLGLTREPAGIVDAIRRGRTRRIDLVERDGHRFAAIAGIGFDAYVVSALSRRRSGTITKLDYVLPFTRAMLHYPFPPLRVRVDSRTAGEDVGFVILGNVADYAAFFRITPRARPDDGLLDVCIFQGRGRLDVLRYMSAATCGLHVAFPDVRCVRGREVVVEAGGGEEVPVEIDGDPAGSLPARFRVLPGEATILVSGGKRGGLR